MALNPLSARERQIGLATVRNFSTRAELAAAVPGLSAGQAVAVGGIPATLDPTATGTASALHDLGVSGVRLSSRVIDGRWFGVRDGAADAAAAITAANTYAKAQKGGANAVTLKLEGAINLRDPVTLGGATALFHIDWSALTVNVVAGGSLASNPTLFAVTCESANSQIKCGRVNANKVCNGVRINNSDNSHVLNPNVRRYVTVGIEVTGNCAGMKLDTPVSVEWITSDPQYFVEAAYVGIGVRADSADFVISKGQVGWCKYCLWITPNGGGTEAHGFHPYNGDVTGTVRRQHPFCVVNEAAGPAFLYDCYVDNGYVDDRSGTLVIQGGWHLVLTDRVELAQPYTRVASVPVPAASGGYIENFGSSIGFFDRSVFNTTTEPLVILAMGQSNMRGNPDATGGARVVEPGVRIWNGSTAVTGVQFLAAAPGAYPMDAGSGLTSNLAIETANMLKRMTGRDVYLIMMAVGGSPIERFITPARLAANGWTASADYTATINSQFPTARSLVPGRTTTYADAFLWHQGEANGGDSAAVYQAKWLEMEAGFRAAGLLSPTKTSIVAGGLVPGVANRQTIETAIRGAMSSRPNLQFVESDGLTASAVAVHFDGQSLERLGARYADTILSPGISSTSPIEAQRGRSRTSGYSARKTRMIPATGDPVDDLIEKIGTGAKILYRYQPGPGAALDVIYKTGAMVVGGKVLTNDNNDVGMGSSGGALDLYAGNFLRWQMGDGGNFYPFVDNAASLGSPTRRVNTVYAASGSINTSDERFKTDIREISDAEARVAQAIKGMVRAYRFRDAVAEKGDGARWHFGVIAQDIAQAFVDEGLNPLDYGVVCFDQWGEQDEQVDPSTGQVIAPYQAAGDRWGIRYDELMMFVLSVM